MAAGEWVSVRSQRELYEREISVEAEELALFPEEERDELSLIYQAKGIPEEEARALAARIMERPETALDTLAREELGIDPGELGSPWVAAGASFAAFATGAVVPVIPYLVTTGGLALSIASGLTVVALFAVGVVISIFTGRSGLHSGVRMVTVGTMAAAVTYGIGSLVGIAVN